ncbi:MAG: hypothetical protein H6746_04125 [Deltaproteobacteria bacterium]|nr:hypothetical protein [Deltaproteobacteria bacterium]
MGFIDRVWVGATVLVALAGGCGAKEDAACTDAGCEGAEVCVDGVCQPVEAPQTTGDLGRFTRVAVRADGRLVIATYDTSYTNLVVRTEEHDGSFVDRIVAGWRVEDHRTVDADAGRWPSIAVADDDAVHLSWYDAYAHALMWARLAPDGTLLVEQVDGGGDNDRGSHSSLALGPDGSVHVAYRDRGQRRLRYAVRSPEGRWQDEPVDGCARPSGCDEDEEIDRGEWAALVLVAGQPRVAFYDRAHGDLDLAVREQDGWRVSVLDGWDPVSGMDTGDVGRFARIALDPKRRVGIAYYDATRGQLRYLGPEGTASGPLRVDDGVYAAGESGALRQTPVGQHVALRYDAQGRAHMIYLDAGRLVMRHATVVGTVVSKVEDVAGMPPGGHVDFRIADDGRIRGAYGPWVGDARLRTRLDTFELAPPVGP